MENFLFPDWQMWSAMVIILAGVVAYASDKFSLEIVSACIIVALLVFFQAFPIVNTNGENVLDARTLLSGFASPALFAIMGLLIIGQGMFQSGALEYPTRLLLTAYSRWKFIAIASVFLLVMLVSAFLNNTPVVVMFIPIMAAIAAQSKVSPSRFMIPLSFMSIFGGMVTLIGSSTNLLAAEAYESVTNNSIGFFALAPLGLCLAGVGALYLLTAGRLLLPDRTPQNVRGSTEGDGKQFIAQIEITRGHPLIGRGAVAGLFPDLPDVTVRMIQRREEAIVPPFDDFVFRLHDTVIVAATRKALTNLLRSKPDILAGVMSEVELREDSSSKGELTMVEAIVAPGSRMIGRTISQIGFRYQTNCVILGIQRRSRMIRSQMNSIRLEAGDVLLLLGDIDDVRGMRSDRDIVLLEWSMQGLPDPSNAAKAAIIFFLVIAAAVLGMPIAISAFFGATMMIATGCLNVRQASRAIDRRIFLLIGAALAMGMALERTGGAEFIAQQAVDIAESGGPVVLLSAFFILSAITTNVLSNNATAVLFTPIAVSAAEQVGIDPLVLVLTVIFGANCSFATPVAYQTNLLVMSPGHYQFRDYLVIGLPLILLMWIFYSFAAPIYFRMAGLL